VLQRVAKTPVVSRDSALKRVAETLVVPRDCVAVCCKDSRSVKRLCVEACCRDSSRAKRLCCSVLYMYQNTDEHVKRKRLRASDSALTGHDSFICGT